MKIVIFNPKTDFTPVQQKQISSLGSVSYTETRDALPIKKLLQMAKGAEIIGVDPDPLGGFEKAKEKLTRIIESLPDLKGVCLSTTSFGWVDLEYAKKRKIPVSNVPGYSRESVAEQALAFLLANGGMVYAGLHRLFRVSPDSQNSQRRLFPTQVGWLRGRCVRRGGADHFPGGHRGGDAGSHAGGAGGVGVPDTQAALRNSGPDGAPGAPDYRGGSGEARGGAIVGTS